MKGSCIPLVAFKPVWFILIFLISSSYYNIVIAAPSVSDVTFEGNADIILLDPAKANASTSQLRIRTDYNALVLYYNPHIVDNNGDIRTVTNVLGMREIEPLMAAYIDTLRKASGGQVNWHITEVIELDEFPPENDPNVTFTPDNYMFYKNRGYDMFPLVDYVSISNDPRFNIVNNVESGAIDAVWVFAFPGTGFWETAMAGIGSYWINGGPIREVATSRKFVFYGFGHEAHQHHGFMLENTGHMVENILTRRTYNWPQNRILPIWNSFDLNSPARRIVNVMLADWQLFFLTDAMNYDAPDQNTGLEALSAPNNSHVGTVHYPPNATFNYGWPRVEENFRNVYRWIPLDGVWRLEGGKYSVGGGNGAKSIIHDAPDRPYSMSDFIAKGSVTVSNTMLSSHAGFLFRMQRFSTGPSQGQGYYVALNAHEDRVVLFKMDYGLTELASALRPIDADKEYKIKISASEENIKIYVEDLSIPLIDINDDSYRTGGFGVSAYQTAAKFDDIDINIRVQNYAHAWHNYPNLNSSPRYVNSTNWNGGHAEYLSWWFEHFPKNAGTHDEGILNTWWPYIFDINMFPLEGRYTNVIFPQADELNPAAPIDLKLLELNTHTIRLVWEQPADNVGVTRYDVYRNSEYFQQIPNTSFTDTGLLPDTDYAYGIVARDGSGNTSPMTTIAVKTLLVNPVGLQNGDFEQGAGEVVTYWDKDPWRPADAVMIWESQGEGYQESRSVSIEHAAENDSRWLQPVNGLVPGAEYKLSGWIKGQDIVNVTGFTGATLGLFDTFFVTDSLRGTFDWTRVSMSFLAPSDGSVMVTARLGYFGSTTTGKAWFDNIMIEPVRRVVNDSVNFSPDPSTFSTISDTTSCPSGSIGKFLFNASLANTSSASLANLQVEVNKLTGQNSILFEGELFEESDHFGVPLTGLYTDGVLAPQENADISFVVCLSSKKSFQLFVNVLGQSVDFTN